MHVGKKQGVPSVDGRRVRQAYLGIEGGLLPVEPLVLRIYLCRLGLNGRCLLRPWPLEGSLAVQRYKPTVVLGQMQAYERTN